MNKELSFEVIFPQEYDGLIQGTIGVLAVYIGIFVTIVILSFVGLPVEAKSSMLSKGVFPVSKTKQNPPNVELQNTSTSRNTDVVDGVGPPQSDVANINFEEELQEMTDKADRDGDGKVPEEEFLRIQRKNLV